jgi:hypothetical protein
MNTGYSIFCTQVTKFSHFRVLYELFLTSGIPKPVAASWKYSKHGLFTKETFQTDNMSENEAQLLSDMANMRLSGSSHKVYQTAKRCEIKKGIDFPYLLMFQKLSNTSTTCFMHEM